MNSLQVSVSDEVVRWLQNVATEGSVSLEQARHFHPQLDEILKGLCADVTPLGSDEDRVYPIEICAPYQARRIAREGRKDAHGIHPDDPEYEAMLYRRAQDRAEHGG